MADPILGMRELTEGDPLGYLSQNDRNLVTARLLAPLIAEGSGTTGVGSPSSGSGPSGAVGRGDMYLIVTGTTGTYGDFTGVSDSIAIALSDTPTSVQGYFVMPFISGIRILATGGTSYVRNVANDGWSTI